MDETISNRAERVEQIYTERDSSAIENALDGYARDGETWIAARDIFEDAVNAGNTREYALRLALDRAAEGAESSADAAYDRFWTEREGEDGAHTVYDAAISDALDGYASDAESWINARDLFYESMLNGAGVEEALGDALDSATEGAESLSDEASERFWNSAPLPQEVQADEPPDVLPLRYTTIAYVNDTWPDVTREIGGGTQLIEKSESESVFEKVEIRGDGRGGVLTPELLEAEGLQPRHKIKTGDRTIWFSRGYDLGGGRTATVGYVQDGDSIVARSYYRSNSQGVWRYLPNYTVRDGQINWYGKGHGEESVTLPALLQESLTRSLEDDGEVLVTSHPSYADAIFTGTARVQGSPGTVYHRNVSVFPNHLNGVQDGGGNWLPRPETVMPVYEQYPDFSRQLAEWQQDTSMYGRVSYEVFASRDGRLQYTFCKDARGRAWISGVENDSPLESTGLHESWVNGGALTTPAYEYRQQAGGYGDDFNARGSYVDMFKNYLSKVPPIQDYLQLKGWSS